MPDPGLGRGLQGPPPAVARVPLFAQNLQVPEVASLSPRIFLHFSQGCGGPSDARRTVHKRPVPRACGHGGGSRRRTRLPDPGTWRWPPLRGAGRWGGTRVRPACCGRLMRSGALGENTGRPSEHLARQSGHSCCRPRPPDPPCGPGLGRVLPWPPSFHRGVASRTTSLPRTPAWRMRGDHLAQTLVPTGHLGGSGSLPRGVSLSSSSSQTRMLDERPRTMLQSPEPGPGPGRPPAARAEAGGAVPSPDSWSPEREGSRPMGKDGDLSPEVRPAGHWSRFQSPLSTSHVAPDSGLSVCS